jgi:hypothetical protein
MMQKRGDEKAGCVDRQRPQVAGFTAVITAVIEAACCIRTVIRGSINKGLAEAFASAEQTESP